MKITFVLPTKNISGGVKSTFELANRMQARGHEVSVVYPLIPGRHGASHLNRQALWGRARGIHSNLEQGNRVEWFDLQADLVRVPWMNASRIPRGDVVVATWWADAYIVHDCKPDRGAKFHVIRHYEVWGGPKDLVDDAYRLPLRKIATSSWLKRTIEKRFDVDVLGPLMNGIETGSFYMTKEGFAAHEPRRIGLMYRRSPWKGMEDAFKALRAVREEYPDIEFVVFGESPSPEDALTMRGLSNLEYHKMPYGDRLRKIYNSLDIFLFPSHSEGFGNPPMEAMACGAACVTTDVGGVSDYAIPGKTALVVAPGRPQEMAGSILSLLADEKKRRELAAAGYEYIGKFSWDDCAQRLEEFILGELAGSGVGTGE